MVSHSWYLVRSYRYRFTRPPQICQRCSTQTQLHWKTLLQGSDTIGPTPVPERVIYGMHEVNVGGTPRLKNKIGAAAIPGINLTLYQMAGFNIKNERFQIYVPNSYTDLTPHGNYEFVKNAYASMQELGLQALLIDIPGLGHEYPREIKTIVKAFNYLDNPQ